MTLARLYIVNVAACAFLAWAYVNGTVAEVMKSDASHMGLVIMAIFAAGVASVFWQTYRADRAYTILSAKVIRIKSEHLALLSGALFILGVIGNAKGLSTAYSNLDVDALTTAEGAAKFGLQVVSGIGSTFGATIIGCTFGLWTMMNAQILFTKLALLEIGEK